MLVSEVILLTQKLISMDSVNPPGNEAPVAKYIGRLLAENGFETDYIPYGDNRLHLVAKKNCSTGKIPVVLSGHLDTVPLGESAWNINPFSGEIKDGKIFGRGTSDMKGGIAAMIIAAIRSTEKNSDAAVCLIFTSGEETGCQGASHLVENYNDFGSAKGIIIGEPTANIPAIGHKGGLYMNVTAKGKTAHSSMPHLGDNAIYKASEAILKIKEYNFREEVDSLLGFPTLNVGKIRGGENLNSVPDYTEFTIDARTTTHTDHTELVAQLKELMGNELAVDILTDKKAVSTKEEEPFVQMVYSVCGIKTGDPEFPKLMPYLTDGAVLQPAFNGAPTVILGPGQPEMAHKTDEFCYINKLEEAVEIYSQIILKGGNL